MKKVVMYDPVVDAYREVAIDAAKKLVASAKEVEAQIAAMEAAEKVMTLEEAQRIVAEAQGGVTA